MATTYNFAQYGGSDMIPDTMTFSIGYNSQISTSPLNGAVQTVELPGARWSARLSYNSLNSDESNTLIAWLARLRGMSGRFVMPDFSHPATLEGVTAGNGNSVAVVGDDIVLTTNALTGGALAVGDKFTLNSELKVVVQKNDATHYVIEPAFRTFSSGAMSFGLNATAKFMLSSDDQATKAVESKIHLGSINIDCMEIW